MRSVVLGAIAAMSLWPARAAVLVPIVPVPNSTGTTAFGINDSDIIAGSYIGSNDGVEHGFFGTLSGSYTTFDAGSGGTEPRGIGNSGVITGFSNSQHGYTSDHPIFERLANGSIVNVTAFGQQLYGLAQGINARNRFAGIYWDTQNFDAVAFVGRNGEWKKDMRIPAEHQASQGFGINNDNVMVGSYFSPPDHGFIVNGRTLTTVDYPNANAQGTWVTGINDKGNVVGQWFDANGRIHSFLLDPATGTFTDIRVKGAKDVAAWGINSKGAVTLATNIGSYIWCKSQRACPQQAIDVDAPVHVMAGGLPHRRCGGDCFAASSAAARRE